MSNRREYLTHLFQLLAARQIPWCVLRNYQDLYAESASDVDLLTLPAHAPALLACCLAAGQATNHHLVQRARFVNETLVFWNGAAGFLRVDVDTAQRWKRFPVLAAREILAARRKQDDFFIPSAAHEVVILLTQALWQGKLTPRYTKRLAELTAPLAPRAPAELAVFRAAFGWRANLLPQVAAPGFLAHLARAVRRKVLTHPPQLWLALGFLGQDARRLISRCRNPPGLYLRLRGGDANQAAALVEKLGILFPVGKAVIAPGPLPAAAKFRALFTGGLALECLPAPPQPIPQSASGLLRHRSFVISLPAGGPAQFIHLGSGATASGPDLAALAPFICATLVRECQREAAALPSRS